MSEIVTDDDTTMYANLKHTKNKDKLRENIPEPHFLADPSHCMKVMVKGIFVKATKKRTLTK